MLLQLFTLVGSLGMFLYGMNLMSSGLQKAAGDRLRHFLSAMTSNRLTSVFTGLGITSIIQSSSATTVMVVGFVNAGLLTLTQAIGIIMGANIGTTVTAWVIALLGFKADISILAVPLMAFGFIMSISKKEKNKNMSEVIIGFALLFLGLSLMKNSLPNLDETPEVLSFITRWTNYGFGSVLIFLGLGTALTLILQSSSATMALTLITMSMGWLPFEMAAAMVLGENVGTTITANIAASIASVNAKRAALAHTFFNLFGVLWALILFKPFIAFVGAVIEGMGYPNPAKMVFTGDAIDPTSDVSTATLYGVSMLHTLFNLINTIILIWFIPQLARVVSFIIKQKDNAEEDVVKLKFITVGHIVTAELAIGQAQNEIVHFAQVSHKGLEHIKSAIHAGKSDEFEVYRKKLVKYEEIADRIEYEIASFLNSIPEGSISELTRGNIRAMFKIVGELESLGDSGESISRILMRKNMNDKVFSDKDIKNIDELIDLVDKAYIVMIHNLENLDEDGIPQLQAAVDCEVEINTLRNKLRDEAILSIERKESYQASVYYMDIIAELERMGDFIINVTESVRGK